MSDFTYRAILNSQRRASEMRQWRTMSELARKKSELEPRLSEPEAEPILELKAASEPEAEPVLELKLPTESEQKSEQESESESASNLEPKTEAIPESGVEPEPVRDDENFGYSDRGLMGRGLLYYRKWWELSEVDICVGGSLLTGIPVFMYENTLRVVNEEHSYFIPLEKIDYIQTTDGLQFDVSKSVGIFSK